MARLAQELREAVLQAALEGALTSREKDDTPVQSLLHDIKESKKQLIDKQIIRDDGDRYKTEQLNKPFDIPSEWEWVILKEIAYLSSGNKYKEENNGYLYIKVADMNLPENTREIITSTRFVNGNTKGAIMPWSIIFPKRGGAISTNKKRKVLKERVYIDSNTMAMTAIDRRVFEYMKLWFDSIDLSKLQTGTSVPQINNKDIYPLLIPLPPIEEQQRIVDRVDELMAKIDEFETIENELEALKAAFPGEMKEALLQAAMEGTLDINVNTENWTAVTLGDMGIIKGGQTPKKNMVLDSGKIPYFKVADMNTTGNEREMRVAKAWLNETYKGKTFPKGSIIYPKNGGAVFTNKKRILIMESLVDLNTGVFIPNNELLDLDYAYYAFLRIDFRKYYKGTALPTVDTASIKQIEYLIPPLDEQQLVVKQLDALLPLCDSLEELN